MKNLKPNFAGKTLALIQLGQAVFFILLLLVISFIFGNAVAGLCMALGTIPAWMAVISYNKWQELRLHKLSYETFLIDPKRYPMEHNSVLMDLIRVIAVHRTSCLRDKFKDHFVPISIRGGLVIFDTGEKVMSLDIAIRFENELPHTLKEGAKVTEQEALVILNWYLKEIGFSLIPNVSIPTLLRLKDKFHYEVVTTSKLNGKFI